MGIYFLSSLILLVFAFLIYSSIKVKKIYSEDIEYEPKHEELIKKVEKRLAHKGFKFKKISKFESFYYLDKRKEKILFPRIRVYVKKFRNYGLIINNQSGILRDNLSLKKEVFDLLISKKVYGVIIFNEKNNSFEFAYREKNKSYIILLAIIILNITLFFVF